MVFVAFLFDVHIASGVAGFLVLILMMSLWAVVYSGFMQIIALKSRSAGHPGRQPHLLPALVPHAKLRAPAGPHEADGDRSDDQPGDLHHGGRPKADPRGLRLGGHGRGYLVVGLALALMLALSVRVVSRYD